MVVIVTALERDCVLGWAAKAAFLSAMTCLRLVAFPWSYNW